MPHHPLHFLRQFLCHFLIILAGFVPAVGVATTSQPESGDATADIAADIVADIRVLTRQLTGKLTSAAEDTDKPPDFREAIIFLRPSGEVQVEPFAEPLEMRMVNKAFAPGVLAITVGSAVRFPNADLIIHNAFSTSSANSFDLGFYGAGRSEGVVFDEPGLVRVFCNVHHAMAAYVMVLDTPYFSHADEQGRFNLAVPENVEGTLYVWHPQARVERRNISAGDEGMIDISLTFNGRRVPRHLNKHGKSYQRSTRPGY